MSIYETEFLQKLKYPRTITSVVSIWIWAYLVIRPESSAILPPWAIVALTLTLVIMLVSTLVTWEND